MTIFHSLLLYVFSNNFACCFSYNLVNVLLTLREIFSSRPEFEPEFSALSAVEIHVLVRETSPVSAIGALIITTGPTLNYFIYKNKGIRSAFTMIDFMFHPIGLRDNPFCMLCGLQEDMDGTTYNDALLYPEQQSVKDIGRPEQKCQLRYKLCD